MKKILFTFVLLTSLNANADYNMNCTNVNSEVKRCVNDEVVCYIYDTGWAGFAKSGRGAGISCLPVVKKQEQKPFFIMIPKNEIK